MKKKGEIIDYMRVRQPIARSQSRLTMSPERLKVIISRGWSLRRKFLLLKKKRRRGGGSSERTGQKSHTGSREGRQRANDLLEKEQDPGSRGILANAHLKGKKRTLLAERGKGTPQAETRDRGHIGRK